MALELGALGCIIGALVWLFLVKYLAKKNDNFPKKKRDSLNNLAILIPARDEALVIEDLLISITKQTKKVNMKDVYVIVEDEHDKTVEFVNNYGGTIFVRKELNLKSKGYALMELIEDLEKKKKYYEAYFIMDADNVLDKDFLKKMEESYKEGYDIATGYRNLKNGNDSLIATTSGITFSFINTSGNETKSKQSRNVTLSGTGLYITGDLIKQWKTYPFHSLTEDYELTLYSIQNNLTSVYNKEAIFYDEQPIKYKDTINQRERWIRGYFDNRKKYIPKFKKLLKNNCNYGSLITEINGMRPYILMIIGVILYILGQFIVIFKAKDSILVKMAIFKIFLILFLAYILFALLTTYVIYKDNKMLNIKRSMKIKTIFFSPLYFLTFIPCALRAVLKKNVSWDKVKHTRRWNFKN